MGIKDKIVLILGCFVVVLFITNYLINWFEFWKIVKGKKTEKLMNHLMNNKSLKKSERKRLFNFITKKRGSAILKPTPLTSEQIKDLPKGKHYVMRKKQMK